jgi:hypothetical protein
MRNMVSAEQMVLDALTILQRGCARDAALAEGANGHGSLA